MAGPQRLIKSGRSLHNQEQQCQYRGVLLHADAVCSHHEADGNIDACHVDECQALPCYLFTVFNFRLIIICATPAVLRRLG